jgi:hypothetical protein
MSGLQQYQQQFTRFIRTRQPSVRPRGVEASRIRVYADLVFAKMNETLCACFPVSREVLGVRRWKRMVRTFLAQHVCVTPIFRQIPEEFLHLLETSQDMDVPAWLPSLAHYEWVELAVAVADTPDIAPDQFDADGDLLQGRPVLAPVMMLLTYPYAVHRISKRYQPGAGDVGMTTILAFRRENFEVKFMELNAVSARLLGLLRETALTGRQALQQIAAEMQHPNPQVVMQGGMEILQSLRQERAILGTTRT